MSRGGVGLDSGAAALIERYVASKEQRLRCRGGGDHFYVVQSRISEASGMSTTPEGTGWKTSMVPLVSMIPVVPRVSVMSKGVPDEIAGLMTSMLLLESRMSGEFTEAAVALCGGGGHDQRSRFWFSTGRGYCPAMGGGCVETVNILGWPP